MPRTELEISTPKTVRNLTRLESVLKTLDSIKPEDVKSRQLMPELVATVHLLGVLLCEPVCDIEYAVPAASEPLVKEILIYLASDSSWGLETEPDRLRLAEARRRIATLEPRSGRAHGADAHRDRQALVALADAMEHRVETGRGIRAFWSAFEQLSVLVGCTVRKPAEPPAAEPQTAEPPCSVH